MSRWATCVGGRLLSAMRWNCFDLCCGTVWWGDYVFLPVTGSCEMSFLSCWSFNKLFQLTDGVSGGGGNGVMFRYVIVYVCRCATGVWGIYIAFSFICLDYRLQTTSGGCNTIIFLYSSVLWCRRVTVVGDNIIFFHWCGTDLRRQSAAVCGIWRNFLRRYCQLSFIIDGGWWNLVNWLKLGPDGGW